jgi:hypothetical protein
MKNRKVLVVFLVVQFVGIACLALWPHAPSAMGIPMWGTALILLCPGNFLGGWLIQSLLWRGPLGLVALGLLSALTAVVINGIIWFAIVKLFRLVFSRGSKGAGATAV